MKTTRHKITGIAAVVSMTALGMIGSVLYGQTNKSWIETAGGDYAEGSHWDPSGVPLAADTIIFGLDSTYTVDFGASRDAAVASVRDGNVTFNVGTGNTLALTGALNVGAESAAAANSLLTINSGSVTGSTFNIADAGKSGTLTVTGANTSLSVTGEAWMANTFGQQGTLNILNGASVTTGGIFRATRAGGSTSNINVDGTDSKLTVNGANYGFLVGYRGTSNVNVTNGATVDAILTGTGSTAQSINIGEGSDLATMTVDNATVNASNALFVGRGGTLNGNGKLIIQNGGKVTVGSELIVGFGTGVGHGEVRVSGAGTSLVINEGAAFGTYSSWIGGRGATSTDNHTGELIVENGATATFGYGLNINRKGTLTIDGASVTAAYVNMYQDTGVYHAILNTGHFNPMLTTTTYANMDGVLNVSLGNGFVTSVNDVYTIVAYGTNLQNQFSNYGEGAIIDIDGYSFELSYGAGTGGGAITLTTVAIPEPAHAAIFFGLGILLLVFYRNRSNR